MAELLAAGAIPTVLQYAYQALAFAWKQYEGVQERKEQCNLLVSRCTELFNEVVRQLQRGGDPPSASDLRMLERTCVAIRDAICKINGRSLVWRLLHQMQLTQAMAEAEAAMSDALSIFNISAHLASQRLQLDIAAARKADHEALTRYLDTVTVNDQKILEALQTGGRERRRLEELVTALTKYVRNLPTAPAQEEPTEAFIRTATKALQRVSGESHEPQKWTVTSLEVTFDREIEADCIGHGGFGYIYKGEWHGQAVAVKEMYLEDARALDRKQLAAVRHEISIWSHLAHPHVLPFYGACLEATRPFMMSRLCNHGNALDFVRAHPEADRTCMLYEVALGMTYLHNQGVVHGDLKATNILIGDDGKALITDFGLSQFQDQTRSASRSRSSSGKSAGTLRWMAPEVLDGEPAQKESDVYSFAMTSWELYSDSIPFAEVPDRALARKVVDKEERPPRPDTMGEELWEIVQACWHPTPGARIPFATLQSRLKPLRSHENAYFALPPSPHISTPSTLRTSSSSPFVPSSSSLRTPSILAGSGSESPTKLAPLTLPPAVFPTSPPGSSSPVVPIRPLPPVPSSLSSVSSVSPSALSLSPSMQWDDSDSSIYDRRGSSSEGGQSPVLLYSPPIGPERRFSSERAVWPATPPSETHSSPPSTYGGHRKYSSETGASRPSLPHSQSSPRAPPKGPPSAYTEHHISSSPTFRAVQLPVQRAESSPGPSSSRSSAPVPVPAAMRRTSTQFGETDSPAPDNLVQQLSALEDLAANAPTSPTSSTWASAIPDFSLIQDFLLDNNQSKFKEHVLFVLITASASSTGRKILQAQPSILGVLIKLLHHEPAICIKAAKCLTNLLSDKPGPILAQPDLLPALADVIWKGSNHEKEAASVCVCNVTASTEGIAAVLAFPALIRVLGDSLKYEIPEKLRQSITASLANIASTRPGTTALLALDGVLPSLVSLLSDMFSMYTREQVAKCFCRLAAHDDSQQALVLQDGFLASLRQSLDDTLHHDNFTHAQDDPSVTQLKTQVIRCLAFLSRFEYNHVLMIAEKDLILNITKLGTSPEQAKTQVAEFSSTFFLYLSSSVVGRQYLRSKSKLKTYLKYLAKHGEERTAESAKKCIKNINSATALFLPPPGGPPV